MAVAAHAVLGRRTGFLHDLATVAGRALRAVPPEPTAVIPAVLVPAFFLCYAIMPRQALTGWFAAIATYNPVTYVINALRALIVTGWDARVLLEGLAALTGIGLVSMSAALLALRGRVAQQS